MGRASRPLSWGRDIIVGLTVASGVGYLATAYTVSRWLTRRSHGKPVPPADDDLRCEVLECRTTDGLRLRGWAIDPPAPRATIALFHGLRRNRAQMLGRMLVLAEAGYRCVAFDHRAHGESQGRKASFGFHERLDVEAVSRLIAERWPDQPVAGLGMSMGAAALCFAGAGLPLYRAFVLESMYHDLQSAFVNRMGAVFPAWFRRFRRGIIWVTERRTGVRLREAAPAEHIGRLAPRPVLLVTGEADCYASPADLARLSERCQGLRESCVIPEAGHMNVFEQGGPVYRDAVLSFLARSLSLGI